MALTPITITGTLVNPDGSFPSGAMTFVLSTLESPPSASVPTGMEDTSTHQIVLPSLVVGSVQSGKLLANPVGAGPYTPLVLLAIDDSTTMPTGLVYIVTEQLSSGSLPPWALSVSHSAAAGTLDIASQRPVP